METPPPLPQSPPQLQSPYAPPSAPQWPAVMPYGAPPMTTADDRSMAMLCHLLSIVTGFIGPLIVWLVKKDTSPFVNHHGREAINFHISLFIYAICLMGIMIILMFVMVGVLLLPFLMLLPVGILVFQIMACIAASRGEWYRYPLCLRLL